MNLDSSLYRRPLLGLFWLLAIFLALFFLIYFKSLLQPFFLAVMIWYLIRELGQQIGRIPFGKKGMPGWLKESLASLVIFSAAYVAVNILVNNLEAIVTNYTAYQNNFQAFVAQVGELVGLDDLTERFREWFASLNLREFLVATAQNLTSTIGNVVMIIIYVIFLLFEESVLPRKLEYMYRNRPKRRKEVSLILSQIFTTTNQYLSLKTLISLITGTLSYLLLLIIGVDYAFLWAFVIFLFNYVPYIGSLVATLLPAMFAVLQFGNVWAFLWVFIGIQVIQNLIGNYLEPRMMGKSLNMSPLVVVMALAFWGAIWGVLGMILSVPITSVLIIVTAQFESTRNIAILLSEKGDIQSLALDPEEVEEEQSVPVE